ncbi:MAG: GFA family protein [Nevskia sp.]
MKELRGRCLCGAVEYRIPDALHYAGYCHCADCRAFSGSAFSAFGGIAEADFRWLRGEDQVTHFAKSEQTVLGFCRVCGSSLYAKKPGLRMIHVRLGTLVDAPSLPPQTHSFVASKAPWFEIGDRLPQYRGSRAAGVLVAKPDA